MNEFLRNFIMTGIRDMAKNGVALYQTYQYASGWFEKGVLMQEDLEEIQVMYQEPVEEEIIPEEVITEEVPEDMVEDEVVENAEEEE